LSVYTCNHLMLDELLLLVNQGNKSWSPTRANSWDELEKSGHLLYTCKQFAQVHNIVTAQYSYRYNTACMARKPDHQRSSTS